MDAASEVNSRIANAIVSAVNLSDGLLDLSIQFGAKYSVQLIFDSSGYEPWDLCRGNQRYIPVGGGQLVVLEQEYPRNA